MLRYNIIHCDYISVVYENFIPWVISTEYEGKQVINEFSFNQAYMLDKHKAHFKRLHSN